MKSLLTFLLFCACAVGSFAQDGTAPTSQVPNGNTLPGTRETGSYPTLPGSRKPKSKKEEPDLKASGQVQEMATDHFVIQTKDHRFITFHLTKDTKILDGDKVATLKDIALGQWLDVEAMENEEEEYFAATLRLKDPPATVVTTAEADADEDARPKLKFGKPTETASAKDAPDPDASPAEREEASSAPSEPKPDPHTEFLEKSRELAFTFTDGLPNYTCQEVVTRYMSETHAGTMWKPQDVVSEEVVWNKDHEEYRNTQIDGKKVNPDKMGDRAWSTGEFGTVLLDLLHPATDAHFTFVRVAMMHHVQTMMFDFIVDQPHSHWTIHEGGQLTRPGFSGTIWFDKATGSVLRLEYSADDLPKEFPSDTAETTLDYDNVQLGQKRFLLPVHSEVLICHRGSSICAKNVIDFRNYHKFGAESDIKFADEQNAPALAPSAQPKPKH